MERRDYIIIAVVSAIVLSLYFKPDVHSIAKFSLQSLVSVLIILFACSIISQLAKPVMSSLSQLFSGPAMPAAESSEDDAVAAGHKMQQAREIAQQSFQLQAAEYVEKIIKPRQEEKRRKREMQFGRFFSHTVGAGHILGEDDIVPGAQENTGAADSNASPAETTRQRQSRLLDKEEHKIQLAAEPLPGADGVITIALRTPDDKRHQRRFAVSDFAKNVVAYMEAIGYSSSEYSLLLPYPRQCISDLPDRSLMELGVISDSALIVDFKD